MFYNKSILINCFYSISDIEPDFSRKLEDIEVKELESAILEVEVNSEAVDVTWHKVSKSFLVINTCILLVYFKIYFYS